MLFDSDAHDNAHVRLVAFRLARELSRRGAQVGILFLLPGLGGEKVGPGDYLVAHGPAALRELLKTALTFNAARTDQEAEGWWQTRDLAPDTPGPEKLKRLAALVPVLARLSQSEAAALLEELRQRLKLQAADLTALKGDLKQVRKEGRRRRKGAEPAAFEPEFSASFPGLVDIVATDDGPAFLVLTPDGPVVAPTWEVDGKEVQPPPVDKLPWLVPRASEVMRMITDPEPPAKLWADLVQWFSGFSELPSPGYHLLQAA